MSWNFAILALTSANALLMSFSKNDGVEQSLSLLLVNVGVDCGGPTGRGAVGGNRDGDQGCFACGAIAGKDKEATQAGDREEGVGSCAFALVLDCEREASTQRVCVNIAHARSALG